MSPRRAVLLTLLAVFAVLALAVGGFLGWRGYSRYQDALDRAEKAEAEAAESAGDYQEGVAVGEENAFYFAGLEEPGWYIVRVQKPKKRQSGRPDPTRLVVSAESELIPCRGVYWVDAADSSVWKRDEEPC